MPLIASSAPVISPETQPFWLGLEKGELILPRCSKCAHWRFPPYQHCPYCGSNNGAWEKASGQGRLYSYVIASNPWPEWNMSGPMSVALIELKEGPRLVSTVVDCPQTPEDLRIDMRVKAAYRLYGESRITMLCFRPADGP